MGRQPVTMQGTISELRTDVLVDMAPTYRVQGKDRLSDNWTVFRGTYAQCLVWADRRAFVVRNTTTGEPNIRTVED